jgi:hypothetical protein
MVAFIDGLGLSFKELGVVQDLEGGITEYIE